MSNILYGYVLPLSCVFDITGADEVYLIDGWNGRDNGYCRINLGRRRMEYVDRESHLGIIRDSEIKLIKIEFPYTNTEESDNSPIINMSDYLMQFGLHVKTVPLKTSEIRYRYRNGWFSNYGYFLQDSSWIDCWTYACRLFLQNGQLKIDGKSVRSFVLSHTSWVDIDIWKAMKTEIQYVLQKKTEISEQDFTRILEKRSIMSIYQYFSVSYYE